MYEIRLLITKEHGTIHFENILTKGVPFPLNPTAANLTRSDATIHFPNLQKDTQKQNFPFIHLYMMIGQFAKPNTQKFQSHQGVVFYHQSANHYNRTGTLYGGKETQRNPQTVDSLSDTAYINIKKVNVQPKDVVQQMMVLLP